MNHFLISDDLTKANPKEQDRKRLYMHTDTIKSIQIFLKIDTQLTIVDVSILLHSKDWSFGVYRVQEEEEEENMPRSMRREVRGARTLEQTRGEREVVVEGGDRKP